MPPSKTSHARHRSFPDASLLDDARPDNNPGPQPWERDLTLAEGVVWMIADEAGLDGRALAEAGIHNMDTAQPVLRLLRAATQAPSRSAKAAAGAKDRSRAQQASTPRPAALWPNRYRPASPPL